MMMPLLIGHGVTVTDPNFLTLPFTSRFIDESSYAHTVNISSATIQSGAAKIISNSGGSFSTSIPELSANWTMSFNVQLGLNISANNSYFYMTFAGISIYGDNSYIFPGVTADIFLDATVLHRVTDAKNNTLIALERSGGDLKVWIDGVLYYNAAYTTSGHSLVFQGGSYTGSSYTLFDNVVIDRL